MNVISSGSDHTITVTAARGPVYVNSVVSYSMSYDAIDIVNTDNLATALSAKIQINAALIGMVRKPSIEDLIVFAKRWGITSEKSQKTI